MRSKLSKRRVFVAMSGGVDSSVAAFLLKKQGYNIVGVFMRCYNLDGCAEQDAEDARRVAGKLNIPFYVFDFEEEYKKKVVDYMIEGYRNGITPNPDVMCNREIKFGLFLKKALAMEADYIATGHYVRIKKTKNPALGGVFVESQTEPNRPGLAPIKKLADSTNLSIGAVDKSKGRGPAGNQTPETLVLTQVPAQPGPTAYSLYQAKDGNKDQSYFLWTITQKQLKRCLFPIGGYLKSEVREIARKVGLPTAGKKDSQGICFLGKVTLEDFLSQYIPEKRGRVLSEAGKVLGEHRGAYFYTIGQRHLGIMNYEFGIKGRQEIRPHYVAEKNIKTNTIILAEGDDNPVLYKNKIQLTGVNFINQRPTTNNPQQVLVRVRYRQPLISAKLTCRQSSVVSYKLEFDEPVKFVAAGQSAVFYLPAEARKAKAGSEGLEMLGGGVIV